MPFDFKKFDAKCASMSTDELQREWEHYTRLISGSATSTAVSGAAIPFTLGVSVIGVGLAAPAIHNARKKREIIERHLNSHGTTHVTRKRDVLTPMAISGTVGLVTLGIGSAGADAVTNAAAEHGFSSIAANEIAVKAGVHLAVDGVALAGEEHHMRQKRLVEAHNAWLRQQSLAGQPEKGGNAQKINSYNPATYGQDTNIAHQNTFHTGPTFVPSTASPAPLSSSPSPSYASTQGYFLSPQPQYSEESTLPPYSENPFVSKQGSPPQPKYSEKPVFYDASQFTPVLSQPQPATPSPTTYPLNPHQIEPERRNSEIRANDGVPGVSRPVRWAQPEAATSCTNQSQDLQSPQYNQATYPMPLAQQAPQPMYLSYPGTMVSNSASQQNDGLDQAMHRLSIASPPPPPPPVQSPGTAPRHNSLDPKPQFNLALPPSHHYQPSENMTSYFPPASPSPAISTTPSYPGYSPMSPPPVNLYSSPLVESPTQYLQTQVQRSPMINPYPTPAQTPGPALNQYSAPPQTLGAFNQPTPPTQALGSVVSPYRTPSQTYGLAYNASAAPEPAQTPGSAFNGYPITVQTPRSPPVNSPGTYHNSVHSQPPQSNPYFPPPPGISGRQPQQQPVHVHSQYGIGAYGYPTPAATPSQKSEGGMYFPPPPTTPFAQRR